MRQTPEPPEDGSTSDDEHELADVPLPLWTRYETDVTELVQRLDPDADVMHDQKLVGKHSGRNRQVDALVTGSVGGSEITIAIECKRYAKKIGIGTVDEFAGKLADLGVDRGVLYAFSGFGAGAFARANGALQPRIELRDLSHPLEDLAPWIERIQRFTGFGDCPNENCYTGDIGWASWPQGGSDIPVEAGSCDICGTWAVRCSECEDVDALFGDEIECCCGAVYQLVWDRKGVEVEDVARVAGGTT